MKSGSCGYRIPADCKEVARMYIVTSFVYDFSSLTPFPRAIFGHVTPADQAAPEPAMSYQAADCRHGRDCRRGDGARPGEFSLPVVGRASHGVSDERGRGVGREGDRTRRELARAQKHSQRWPAP